MRSVPAFLLPLAACGVLTAAPLHAEALTPAQVIQHCEAAYDGLHTYQVTVNVDTTSGARAPRDYHTTANILFQRPGKIQASGTSMMGGHYGYLSDGTTTIQNIAGNRSKVESQEMAIAGATGIAMHAATTVPCLLLHTKFGYPFSLHETYSPAVATDTVGGHPCYRVSGSNGFEDMICWVDKKTFLLRRYATTSAMLHLHKDEIFSGERINAVLPAGTFQMPAGQ